MKSSNTEDMNKTRYNKQHKECERMVHNKECDRMVHDKECDRMVHNKEGK